jgi:small conductance mechanosensitive channel
MNSNPDLLKIPAAFVGVSALGDSSVNLAVSPYATPDKYWDVYFSIYEDVKNVLDKEGIEIPYPHVQVNLNK